MPIPVETAAGSRDQRQDVFGSGTPRASGTVRWTGEVAAEKILHRHPPAARGCRGTPSTASFRLHGRSTLRGWLIAQHLARLAHGSALRSPGHTTPALSCRLRRTLQFSDG